MALNDGEPGWSWRDASPPRPGGCSERRGLLRPGGGRMMAVDWDGRAAFAELLGVEYRCLFLFFCRC
eukprot:762930-Hanusia_phi.AAC.1